MTSWQNILDHLPTGTGRPGTQEHSKRSYETTQKPSASGVNESTDPSRQRQAQERQLVFLPRKRNVSAPKFNLLGLKPTEDFQPYNMGFFQPRGLIEDENVWKKSLRDMAMSLGFITQNEIERIEKPATLANFYGPPSTTGSLRTSVPSTTGSTPRFNEHLPPASRGERLFVKGFTKPGWYYRVDDHEREAWMLQVLCQILGTDDLSLVQTWLGSSHKAERDLARQLIVRALHGLGEGDRFRTSLPSLDVNMDALNNFVNGIEVPQLPVDGIFQPTSKRAKRNKQLRSLDENKAVHDMRTDEELAAEFSSPTLAVMQTTPSGGSKRGNTARLRTPFLPPIPARWMMHNDGSFATGSAKKSTSESDLTQMHSSHPTNLSSVFS